MLDRNLGINGSDAHPHGLSSSCYRAQLLMILGSVLQADHTMAYGVQEEVCSQLLVLSENRHTRLHGLGSSQSTDRHGMSEVVLRLRNQISMRSWSITLLWMQSEWTASARRSNGHQTQQ